MATEPCDHENECDECRTQISLALRHTAALMGLHREVMGLRNDLQESVVLAEKKREEEIQHGGRTGIGARYWSANIEANTLVLRRLDRMLDDLKSKLL